MRCSLVCSFRTATLLCITFQESTETTAPHWSIASRSQAMNKISCCCRSSSTGGTRARLSLLRAQERRNRSGPYACYLRTAESRPGNPHSNVNIAGRPPMEALACKKENSQIIFWDLSTCLTLEVPFRWEIAKAWSLLEMVHFLWIKGQQW